MISASTEDKAAWIAAGNEREVAFVRTVAPYLALEAEINPAKASDPYAPDLVVAGRVSELKYRTAPFFTATRYGFQPQTCVTFNSKDYRRYLQMPDMDVYWWVHWEARWTVDGGGWGGHFVAPMRGVWVVPFSYLAWLIERGYAPLHVYQRRVADTAGNGRESYLFNLAQFQQLIVSNKPDHKEMQ